MGILKKALEKTFADMGIQAEFLNTGSRVIQSSAQAKYSDTRKAEKGYIQGVHNARKEAGNGTVD